MPIKSLDPDELKEKTWYKEMQYNPEEEEEPIQTYYNLCQKDIEAEFPVSSSTTEKKKKATPPRQKLRQKDIEVELPISKTKEVEKKKFAPRAKYVYFHFPFMRLYVIFAELRREIRITSPCRPSP